MRLKELRKNEKLTQSDMAKILNVSQTSYGTYELGTSEPTIESLCKLADYYNVSLDYLVGRDFKTSLGYLSDEDMAVMKVLQLLSKENKIKVLGYVSGILATQE